MISHLSIISLRNIQAAKLEPCPSINLIYGDNASGKTSLLESIYFLGMGRSFRTTTSKPVVAYGEDNFTLSAKVDNESFFGNIGIERYVSGDLQIKVAGKKVSSLKYLSQHLPLLIIDSQSFNLLDGVPGNRRKFINWGLFYQYPQFFNLWRKYHKCLQQRNNLLKQAVAKNLIDAWDVQLVTLAKDLDRLHATYISQLVPIFSKIANSLIKLNNLELVYYCGWAKNKTYVECLRENLTKDMQRGFTTSGPHRADIKILVDGFKAYEVLSRGQKKLLVAALLIAQGYLMSQETGKKCIYLIDDLAAELDNQHIQVMCKLLEDMRTQVFLTAIDKHKHANMWHADTKVKNFYIDNGLITTD